MRIVYFGSGEFGCATLTWLKESEHELVEVVTQPARPAGRGRKTIRTAISVLAEQMGLAVVESGDVNTPEFVEHVGQLAPQVIVVVAFGQKIGAELLRGKWRMINLHGSLLPRYRGAAPINWAIINGESQTGLTMIELNERWDAGDILGQSATAIGETETAGELHDRLAKMGPELVAEVLDRIAQGSDEPLVQDSSTACRAPKLQKGDGAIRWDQSAEQIRNQIHGMWPWPGAYCRLEQVGKAHPERLTVARAEVSTDSGSRSDRQSGALTEELNVVCGTGVLKLLEVKPDNGKLMSFDAFVNGRRVQVGDRFIDG